MRRTFLGPMAWLLVGCPYDRGWDEGCELAEQFGRDWGKEAACACEPADDDPGAPFDTEARRHTGWQEGWQECYPQAYQEGYETGRAACPCP